VQNILILHSKGGSSFTSAEKAKFNDQNRIFGEKDGFQMAIAVVDPNMPDFKDPKGRE